MSGGKRFDRLDALRAVAIVWMACYHFCFDLSYFGFIPRQNFNGDWFWLAQRSSIVSLFLFCAGAGQAVALAQGQSWQRFGRRWAQVALCALLVTAGSWFMFPRSFIYFGVLHGIAVMLLLSRLTAAWGAWLWLAGAAAIAAPHFLGNELFNPPWLNWTGLITRKPITEDYVPLLPWLGVMWWGMAATQWVLARRPGWLAGPVPTGLRPMSVLGRWSLTFYMVHQPLLIGALMLVKALHLAA